MQNFSKNLVKRDMRRQNEGKIMEDCRTTEGWNSFELRKKIAIIFAKIIGRMLESLTRD